MIRRLVLALAVVVVLMLGLAPAGGAQSDDPGAPAVTWTALDAIPDPPDASVDVAVAPERFQALSLDEASLITDLGGTPVEPSPGAAPAGGGSVISLPTPDGGFEDFEIVEAPVMEPDLAAQFPDIRTYGGQGLDDPAATVKIDVSDQGFHAQVLSPDGAWYIDPYYHLDTSVYVSYFKRDLSSPHAEFTEELVEDLGPIEGGEAPTANRSGTMLRTHRAVFAATGEYTTFHGGTVPQAQAAIVTAINRVNGIYEVEVAVRMVLVGDNANVVFTNSGTDPYCNCSDDIDTNQGVVDGAIGSVNYDVGHVFTTASGGVAGLGVVGVNGQKARGTTGTANPINDPFVVDFVAHEVGHQYGGNHPFNGNRGSCTGGNRNGPTAYEPGSGSTIQGYAGICGLDNLQLVGNGATGASDPYFHSISFDEIVAHTTGGSPGDIGATPTGNSVPTANAGANGVIPARTPFLLEGAGTDANGADVLTYNWEQRDLGQQRALDNPENSAGPLFRSFVATASNTRYLPKLSTIAAGNTNVTGGCGALTGAIGAPQACWSEFIPTVSRTMNFRLTVRDNRANGGGVNTDDVVVTVNDTGAPFAVTSQAAPVVYAGGSNQTVTWSVSGTSGGAINAPNVDIRLSTDGGNSFPTVVLADTPNDGTQAVTIPNVNTAQARIMVVESGAGQGVRFFNINAANFTIGGGGCVDNDDFGCAAVLGGPPASVNGSNVGFGVEGGEPSASCAFGADPSQATAWWNWTAPASGSVTIDTEGSVGLLDTQLAVYTGNAVNALAEVACDDDGGTNFLSSVTFAAVSGTTYRVQVDGYDSGTGAFKVNVSGPGGGPTCNGLAVTVDLNVGQVPTAGADVILGTPGADVIVALGGDDTICAQGGADTVNAGPGADWVDAGSGDDIVFGQDGDDTIGGGLGQDQLLGFANNDTIDGGAGADVINGGPGNDTLDGGDQDDQIYGQGGNDTINAGPGADFVIGVDGLDVINGEAGNDTINGGPDADTVSGGPDNDTIYGLTGNDPQLNGDGGNDFIFGQVGNDTVNGGAGNDNLWGNEQNDTITDPSGTNVINAGPGDDNVTGGVNADTIYGDGNNAQGGNDTLNGGLGTDLVIGFAGNDTITANDGIPDTVNGGPGADTCTTDPPAIDTVFFCNP